MRKSIESIETPEQLFKSHKVDALKVFGAKLHELIKLKGNPSSKLVNREVPTRKADLVQYLVMCMNDTEVLKSIYVRLGSLEGSAVRETIDSPSGKLDLPRFHAKYGASPNFSNSWEYYKFPKRRAESEFAWLSLWMTGSGIMPRELHERLKTFVKPPRALTASYLKSLPEIKSLDHVDEEASIVVHSTENAAIRDVMAMLQLIGTGKTGIGAATGKPTKAGAKAIRSVLSAGDYYPEDLDAEYKYDLQIGEAGIRPFAWAMLMQGSNLAQANGKKLGLSRSGIAALKKKPAEILKQIWNRWLKSKILHEFNRVDAVKGQKSKARPLAVAPPARLNIARTLAELDEGKWIEIDSFFKFLIASGNDITIARNSWKLYIGDVYYGSLGYDNTTWEHVEGRFAGAFLLEYAATLGVIDVALIPPWNARNDLRNLWGADDLSCLSRYDGLIAIRLNSLGAWILGNKEKYEPAVHDEPCFQVLPNLEVSRIGTGAAPGDFLFLERFCEKISEGAWRLSPQKVLECTETGIGVSEIRKFLEDRNHNELPQPVLAFLKDMKKRTGQVKDMGPARMIVCATNTLARLIADDKRLRDLCMHAGGRLVVVPSKNEAQFKKALRELGYGMVSRLT